MNFRPGRNFVKGILAFEKSLEFLYHIGDLRLKCSTFGRNSKNSTAGRSPYSRAGQSFFPQGQGFSVVEGARSARRVLCKWVLQEEGQLGRCFLPRSSSPPGPETKYPGNVNPPQADPRQSRGFTLLKLLLAARKGEILIGR